MNKKISTLLAALAVVGSGTLSAQVGCPSDVTVLAPSVKSGDFVYLRNADATTGNKNVIDDGYFAVTKGFSGDSVIVATATGATAGSLAYAGDSAIWQVSVTTDGKYYSYKNKATGSNLSVPVLDSNNKVTAVASTFGWNYTGGIAAPLLFINNTTNYSLTVGASNKVGMGLVNGSEQANVYASTIPWVKVTASELNTMYNGYFQMFDKSATSDTDQADSSHMSIQSKFVAVQTNGTPAVGTETEYMLQVLNRTMGAAKKPVYFNIDTTYYDRIGLVYDSTAQTPGHTLCLDTVSTVKAASTYEFTIWKNQIVDSLAIQVYGIPTAEKNSTFAATLAAASTSADVDPATAWITLTSYDAGLTKTALSAGVGCFSKTMPNPQFGFFPGTGVEIASGFYYILNQKQDTMLAVTLDNRMSQESPEWVIANDGKQFVPAAQWFVPETSVTPSIYNRESSATSITDGARFYQVMDKNGNPVANTYEVMGGTGLKDTVVMLPFTSNDKWLGYNRFAETAKATAVTKVYPLFNSVLVSGSTLNITSADSLLTVNPALAPQIYNVLPVDTFSIGVDSLRAISYKFFQVQGKDTVWISSDLVNGYQYKNTSDKTEAAAFLMRSTYTEGQYQMLEVPAANFAKVLSSEDRIAAILAGNRPTVGFVRPVWSQVSVIASSAQVVSEDELNDFNGLWSFENPLKPEYATLTPAPAHYTFTSSQNVDLAISMNNANAATLKGTSDLKAETYTEDNFKLFVQCVDADTVMPKYMISTQQAAGIVGDTALFLNAKAVAAPGYTTANAQDSLGFAKALLDTTTFVLGKDTLVAATAVKAAPFRFAFRVTPAANTYVIEAEDGTFLAQYNGVLVGFDDLTKALPFVVKPTSTPTSNEGVTVSEVTVIAGQGNVTIAGAAGKKVVISNIIGQVVANTVLSSDNAVVAAPQGVVVVAVEGEAAVKAIVK